jgi:hypothetical protein
MLIAFVFALALSSFPVLRLGAYVYPGQHRVGHAKTSTVDV